nr:fibronectin type III domain-containing protein [Eubacterium sp.]
MRRGTKRALSFMLATAMGFAVLSGAKGGPGKGQVEAAGKKDDFGISIEQDADFKKDDGKNPYGEGVQTFNTKSEAFIWKQDEDILNGSSFNYTKTSQLDGEEIGNLNNYKYRTTVTGGSGRYRYVSTKGYDPNKTGHDNMIAMVGCDYDSDESKLIVARYNAAGTGSTSRTFSLKYDRKNDADWLGSVPQWAYTNYFTLTTGDFDGDGRDEIAVYVPQANTPYIKILNGNSLADIRTINVKDFMGETGAQLSHEYNYDSRTARSTIQISMDAADVDRDGKDDLLVVGSYADLVDDSTSDDITERSSVFACYLGADQSSCIEKEVLNMSNTGTDDAKGKFIRTAAVSAGDIDFDGFPEIVIAGNYSSTEDKDAEGEDQDSLDGGNYAIVTYKYDPDATEDKYKLEHSSAVTVAMNTFTKDGFYRHHGALGDWIQKVPALTCVAANGMNAAESIFLSGTFYSYVKGTWNPDYTVKFCEESDNAINGYVLTNTWIDQCVAGNFDENNLGCEQVLFTAGYKQDSTEDYFYRFNLAGMSTKTEGKITSVDDWYESNNKNKYAVYHTGKSDKPAVAVAALDIDEDTDTFVYKKKEYVFSDVQVAAILQAAPYFEDIKDDYGDLGTTYFGVVDGHGQATSKTNSAQVGAYLSFSTGPDAMKFSTEASFTHEWEWEYEKEVTKEIEFGFSSTEVNSVVIYRIPAVLYHYTVTPGDKKKKTYDMELAVQEAPSYTVMSVEEFNKKIQELEEKENKNKEALKSKMITESVISNIEGRPDTYPNGEAGLKNFVSGNGFQPISNKVGYTGTYDLSVNDQTSESTSESYSNNFELKLGISGEVDAIVSFDYSIGVSAGAGWGGGSTTIDYKGMNKSASVAYPPKTESEYSFNCEMGTWAAKVGDSEVPVIGYLVRNIKMPPSPPRNLSIDTITDHSIKVGWELGCKKADAFEIYQVFDDGVTDNPYSFLDTVPGNVTTYTFDNLEPASTYSLAMRAISKEDGPSQYTNTVTATTLGKGDSPFIARITKEQNVVAGDSATFKVEASPSSGINSGLAYSWQMKKAGTANWIKINENNTKSSYTIKNVTQEMDGDLYRCVVAEIHNGTRRYCYSDNGILHVGKADTVTTVTALNDSTGQNSGYADVTKQVEVKTPVMENKIIKLKVGENENSYEIYQNDNNNKTEIPYIYRDVDNGKFYILSNVNEANKTAGDKKEVTHREKYVTLKDGDGTIDINVDDFTLQTEKEGEEEKIQEIEVGGTKYWTYAKHYYNDSDQTISKSFSLYKVAETENQIDTDTEKYYILKIDDKQNKSMEELEIHSYGNGEYRAADNTSVIIGDAVQTEIIYTTYEDEVDSGDKVTISIQVTKKSTNAELGNSACISLLNTNTGDMRLIPADVDDEGKAEVTWIPDKEGIYSITADYSGSNTTKTSSAATTYYAVARQDKSMYVVKANDTVYGGNITLNTFKCEKDENGTISETKLPGGLAVNYK